jgi:hypothetical protein
MEIFVPPPPYAQPPVNAAVPFQIFRQPMKSADEPVTLPIGAMVDLTYSGVGNGVEFSVPTPGNPLAKFQGVANGVSHIVGVSKPVLVMFGPSGKLASVHYAHRPPTSSQPVFDAVKAITPVYLLVGPTPSETGTAPPNFMNQDSVWVAVNPQSGLVTTGEVAIGADYFAAGGAASLQQNDYAKAIRDSRAFARSQQNMGGR